MEHDIRLRAYQIWEHNGRSGDPAEHWYAAERELTLAAPVSRSAKVRARKPRTEAVPPSAKTKSAAKHALN